MLIASSTPNHTRSMPSLSATGAISGMMMKASSKKSRKKARTKIRMLTTIRKPSWPPGRLVSRCSTQIGPSTAWNDRLNTVEPIRMKSTKQDSFIVASIAWRMQLTSMRRRRQRHHQRADRAHRAAFGRRGDAEEDRAEHQEDQGQRRDQHERDPLGHARQQAEAEHPVDDRQHEGDADADAHRDDDQLVGRRRAGGSSRSDRGRDRDDERPRASAGRQCRRPRGSCAPRAAARRVLRPDEADHRRRGGTGRSGRSPG